MNDLKLDPQPDDGVGHAKCSMVQTKPPEETRSDATLETDTMRIETFGTIETDAMHIKTVGGTVETEAMPTNVDSLEKPGLHEEEPGLHDEEPSLHDEEPGLHDEEPGLHDEEPGAGATLADGYLLAEEPGASKAPPDGAHLERLANEHQVNPIEDGDTLAGNEFDGSRHEARDHELKPHLLFLVYFPDQQQQRVLALMIY